MRGVVDSDDLPLNVGREILQQSRALRIIKQRLVKKCVEMMSDLASSNATAYNSFFKNFGKYVKIGIIEDEKSRDDLIPLVRFFSSHSDSNMTSLPEYVARMPEDQKNIYYVVGETRAQAAMSPTLGTCSIALCLACLASALAIHTATPTTSPPSPPKSALSTEIFFFFLRDHSFLQ